MAAKNCNKCLELRPLSQFRKRGGGRPGHSTECDLCRSARRRARYAVDDDYRRKILDAQRAINASNPVKNRAKARAWAVANPERALERKREWRKANNDHNNAYQREWIKRNKGTKNAATARRAASRILATPKWVTKAEIRQIYKDAASRGLHVDHIVPLRSEIVCGLHVPWNLQLLTEKENREKSNKIWPDMP